MKAASRSRKVRDNTANFTRSALTLLSINKLANKPRPFMIASTAPNAKRQTLREPEVSNVERRPPDQAPTTKAMSARTIVNA